MSQNLLVERLKRAKRELTALKSAHTRGIGNLRVYSNTYTPPSDGHESGYWYLVATVKFDSRFTAYPFAYILPSYPQGGSSSIEAISFNYANNGYSARFGLLYRYNATTSFFRVVSTAPIIEINYDWYQP